MKSLSLIFWDNSWSFDGDTPEESPLGGAHSALVYLTRALATLGHRVDVYNHCPAPAIFHGVEYHKIDDIVNFNKYVYADAFISLRDPDVFRFFVNAGARILWAQDSMDQPNLCSLKTDQEIRQNIDSIFCLSRWQTWTFMNHFHWPAERLFVTRNAVRPDFFPTDFPEPEGRRLVYTSTPFRGLELLLTLFPAIRHQIDDAELHVFSSMEVYNQAEEDHNKFGHIYALGDQPGVFMHGSIGQRRLAGELTKCKLFAYPNTFAETACIAAMEALAAGCAAVTSKLAALPETIGPGGLLITGMPGQANYNKAFVEGCVTLLSDEALWRETAVAGREWILNHYTWDKVAVDWSKKITQLVEKTSATIDRVDGWRPASDWRQSEPARR